MIKLEWLWNEVKWGLNDLIRCCLLIGDSTRLNHSDVIPPHSSSFRSQSMWEALIKMEWCWNDWMMLEWRASQNPVFFSPSKNNLIPLSFRHSNIIPSFLKCKGMKITMEGISFKSHSSHLYFIQSVSQSFNQSCHSRNDGMRRNEGRFLKQGQTLNSENHLIPLSFRHSMSLLCSSHGHSIHLRAIPVIWGSFLIPMSFQFKVNENIHPLSTLYSFRFNFF